MMDLKSWGIVFIAWLLHPVKTTRAVLRWRAER